MAGRVACDYENSRQSEQPAADEDVALAGRHGCALFIKLSRDIGDTERLKL